MVMGCKLLHGTQVVCFIVLFMFQICYASGPIIGRLNLGFSGSYNAWIDNVGIFLVSNNSNFGFGITRDVDRFILVVKHQGSQTVVWAANRGSPIQNSDDFKFDDTRNGDFKFDDTGNAYLQEDGTTVWSTDTAGIGVSAMELLDSGNLVLHRRDGSIVWQSFSHPSDTLLSNQEFSEGMRLVSNPGPNNLSYSLEIRSGDMILSANFQPAQPYWSMRNDNRIIINKEGGMVAYAVLNASSWKFYDTSKVMLWQFIVQQGVNDTWAAVLGDDGFITFFMLGYGRFHLLTIPEDECGSPTSCEPYNVCSLGKRCQCPFSTCRSLTIPTCGNLPNDSELLTAGDGLGYFPLGFAQPFNKTTLGMCKSSCLANCSCGALFFQQSSGNCFLFNTIGSLERSSNGVGYTSFIKVLKVPAAGVSGSSSRRHFLVVVVLVVAVVISGFLSAGFYFYRKKKREPYSEDEDVFLETLSKMPVRFSYKDLAAATNNFSLKLGQGGFGSVYKGTLSDGSLAAVKKLEGIGQGKKEFRAEVNSIGNIHHLNLVRLKGFCTEKNYRLLVYEFVENGSLEKWLFKDEAEHILDWQTRHSIAVDTAKGLAYLHEDCDVKIVHCDIKPENVLLDSHFRAKISDFGLARLMTREQSHVVTTLRGTIGYIAPERYTSYTTSEKSDVYSYGMVLLELIGGRKNFDQSENSEKSQFPSYAFKMLEEGKLKDIVDVKLNVDDDDERVAIAIKVALWCIQDNMHLRPSMSNVVQMLEGRTPVPAPPVVPRLGSRLYSSFLVETSSEPALDSDAFLSGPR